MVNRDLIRFTAHVSIALYVALLFAEYLRPGFVSTVVNVHAMWLGIVPLILVLNVPANSGSSIQGRGIPMHFALSILGIVFGLIVWHLGDVFGGMRFWFAVAVGLTPLALFRIRA